MKIHDNELYKDSIKKIANININWDHLNHKTFMISGSTGLIGRFFVDVLMYMNLNKGYDFKFILLGRNEAKGQVIFTSYLKHPNFKFVECDVNQKIIIDEKVDYILHLASNTHPRAYSSDPIGTITTNVIGTYNLLNYAVEHHCERFLMASTVEVYGESRNDVESFDEKYLGYIDCNTLRAGYPESKRCSESLCQAFINQEKLDVVIARLSRVYGPTMNLNDSKALSQFILNSVNGENIVLKSEGTQLFSYTYVADAVSAILFLLDKGVCGEAYNVSDKQSNIHLKDLAKKLADISGTQVVFELPDQLEKRGYSTATKAVLNSEKIQKIGWKAMYDINKGLEETIHILKEL